MRIFSERWQRFSVPLGLLAATLLCTLRSAADSFGPDRVDEIRTELRAVRDDLSSRFPEVRKQLEGLDPTKSEKEREILKLKILNNKRESLLMTRVEALRTIPEMRRAIVLNDWRLDVEHDETAAVDLKVRNVLIDRFEKAVRDVLQHGSTSARLAVIKNLAEFGVSPRTLEDKSGIVRDFGPDLAEEIKTAKSPLVRAMAARGIGQIFPDPKVASRALGQLLATGNVEERRDAVVGLASMVQVAAQLVNSTKSGSSFDLKGDRSELAAAGKAALPEAGKGLFDPDPEVRRLSAAVFQQAGFALRESAFANTARSARTASAELKPLLDAFKEQAPNMAKALTDQGSPSVRLLVARALEHIAEARILLERAERGEPVPRLPIPGTVLRQNAIPEDGIWYVAAQKPALDQGTAGDPLLETLRANVSALARATTDPSAEVRLKALDAIETIGSAAEAASPALINALDDSNFFVRWAAARALGKVGTKNVGRAIPALARLLQDRDFDVNIAAAKALARFGPDAKAAVPELILALSATDEDKRKEVLTTLQSIGTDASPAIPAVAKLLLTDPEAPARQLAAQLLGKFGPAAAPSIPALRQALLDDPDPDVRRAASDALLNIEK